MPIFTVYCNSIPLSGINTMSLFKTAKQGYIVDFVPVYGTLNASQLLRVQHNREGDTDVPFTVTEYLFLENMMPLFILTWILRTYVFSSSSQKPPRETYIICLFDESPIAHRATGIPRTAHGHPTNSPTDSPWASHGQPTGSPTPTKGY